MHHSGDPPAICCYSTTFLSVTRRLLSSRDELAREVQANSSPLGRFLSLSGHASSQSRMTGGRLRSSLDQARRVRVRRNELTKRFLHNRDHPGYGETDLLRWKDYQRNQGRRHYLGHVLCCNYTWGWDLSKSLKRLFRRSNTDDVPIRSSKAQGSGWLLETSDSHVPGVLTVKYRTTTGEVRHKTFRADPSPEDFAAQNHAPYDNTPLLPATKEPVAGSSSSESRLEYKNILEYREINRHVRRKIEAWLNDGWSVEWEWNRKKYWIESEHQMTLRRLASDDGLPFFPSPSNKKIVLEFPTTPEEP